MSEDRASKSELLNQLKIAKTEATTPERISLKAALGDRFVFVACRHIARLPNFCPRVRGPTGTEDFQWSSRARQREPASGHGGGI